MTKVESVISMVATIAIVITVVGLTIAMDSLAEEPTVTNTSTNPCEEGVPGGTRITSSGDNVVVCVK